MSAVLNAPLRAFRAGLSLCRTCGLVSKQTSASRGASCPRCGVRLEARAEHSLERTLAWLIAGILFYVPANVLPIMYTSAVGGGHESTILGGVIAFWRAGSPGIALIIFTASVLVPTTKFLTLGTLLYTVKRGSPWAAYHRTLLHRLVEAIGYWSMLDVVVVALSCTLLRFDAFATAEPRLGIVFFCACVVTTMMAAMSFDTRLIWGGVRHAD